MVGLRVDVMVGFGGILVLVFCCALCFDKCEAMRETWAQ